MSDANPPESIAFKERVAVGLLKASACLPLGLSRIIGRAVGQVAFWLKGRMHDVTAENLSLCFPQMQEAERDRLTRNSLIQTSQMMMETGAIWLRDYDWVRRRILKIHNQQILDDALARLEHHFGLKEADGLFACA